MSRWRWIVLAIILAPVVASGAAIAWHYYRLHDGSRMVAAARAQVQPLGGWIDQGLVDGDFYVHLEQTNIDDRGFVELAKKLHRFPPPHLDQNHTIEIYAGKTRITDKSIAALRGAPVAALDVHGTAVSDASVPTICEFSLWQLDLRETKITDASVSKLSKLQLMRLGVSNSQVTAKGIRQLKAKMPQTEIH